MSNETVKKMSQYLEQEELLLKSGAGAELARFEIYFRLMLDEIYETAKNSKICFKCKPYEKVVCYITSEWSLIIVGGSSEEQKIVLPLALEKIKKAIRPKKIKNVYSVLKPEEIQKISKFYKRDKILKYFYGIALSSLISAAIAYILGRM